MKKIMVILLLLLTIFYLPSFAKAVKQSSSSSMPIKISPPGGKLFIFNPKILKWGAYDATGNRVAQGLANGGDNYCADVKRPCFTPSGTYRIISKGNSSCKSTRFPIKKINGKTVRGGAPMPYCMFFSKYYAIHGSPHMSNGNVSHGCIRVTTSAAKWLSSSFIQIGTKVKIMPY